MLAERLSFFRGVLLYPLANKHIVVSGNAREQCSRAAPRISTFENDRRVSGACHAFESMAAETADAKLKETLLGQARAYWNRADERAVRLKITLPPSQKNST
jgi:hypothetical protein